MGDREDGATMTPETAVMILNGSDPDRHSIQLRARAAQVVAQLVERALPAPFLDATGPDGNPRCWHFIGYRPGAAQLRKHSPSTLNAPDAPQYQGVIFADGTVAMRWLTAKRSTSTWDTFADMFDVHGHPEYGTELHWPDGAPQEARDAIERAAQEYRDREADLASEREREEQLAAEKREEQLAAEERDAEESGRTVAVCLDCNGALQPGAPEALVIPLPAKEDADSWIRVHVGPDSVNAGHRAVSVPGWPTRDDAIAIAREHLNAQDNTGPEPARPADGGRTWSGGDQ